MLGLTVGCQAKTLFCAFVGFLLRHGNTATSSPRMATASTRKAHEYKRQPAFGKEAWQRARNGEAGAMCQKTTTGSKPPPKCRYELRRVPRSAAACRSTARSCPTTATCTTLRGRLQQAHRAIGAAANDAAFVRWKAQPPGREWTDGLNRLQIAVYACLRAGKSRPERCKKDCMPAAIEDN
jgi:hypothetical protein